MTVPLPGGGAHHGRSYDEEACGSCGPCVAGTGARHSRANDGVSTRGGDHHVRRVLIRRGKSRPGRAAGHSIGREGMAGAERDQYGRLPAGKRLGREDGRVAQGSRHIHPDGSGPRSTERYRRQQMKITGAVSIMSGTTAPATTASSTNCGQRSRALTFNKEDGRDLT